MIPVNVWGVIRYGYKSPLIFVHSSGKNEAFTQVNYLHQVLSRIQPILEAFATVTHLLRPSTETLFIEDGNSAHGHKSSHNCCAQWRTQYNVILMPPIQVLI
jgi:hypothetical protein